MSKIYSRVIYAYRQENIFEIKQKSKLTTVNWQIVPRFT